jgi:hypothetical protein
MRSVIHRFFQEFMSRFIHFVIYCGCIIFYMMHRDSPVHAFAKPVI